MVALTPEFVTENPKIEGAYLVNYNDGFSTGILEQLSSFGISELAGV